METTPQPRRGTSRSDLVHLRSLPFTQPATKIGQVAWAWEEIQAGLAAGRKLKEIWQAAQQDGLDISYAQFRVYLSRLRRRSESRIPKPQPPAIVPEGESPTALSPDPFRNLRRQREKKKQSGFEYDPFSARKNLVD